MPISRADEMDLLTALHEGPYDAPPWATFLHRLRGRTDADRASLMFRQESAPASGMVEYFAERNTRSAGRKFHPDGAASFTALPFGGLRPSRIYTLPELLDLEAQSNIIEPHPIPGGIYARMARIVAVGGANIWVMIARGDRDFSASDGILLSTLVPHIEISLRNYTTIERERRRSLISEGVTSRLHFAWIALDDNGRLVDADNEGRRLLEASDDLSLSSAGQLLVRGAGNALADAVRDFARDPLLPRRAIHITDEPRLELLLAPVREWFAPHPSPPVLIAYIHGADGIRGADDAGPVEQLRQLFDLSNSEARLAAAISRGLTLAEAAEAQGITIETARYYSKRIFAKAGVRGQPELVRRILTGVTVIG